MDLDAVAGELYGLLPEEFALTRKVRAGEAQAAGNRDLAAAIRQLRRPTTSAWLANLLVRERPTQIAQLLELGTAMHRAQADLVGEEMRQLSQQRQGVVTSLSDAARQLAHDLGKQASDATMRELEETLEAAIADSEARDALASGHLAAAMRYSGLGAETRGVATTSSQKNPRAARRGTAAAQPRRPPGRAADEAGPEKRRQARSAVARAEREATEHARRRQRAMEDVDRCNRAIGEAEDLLRSLRSERSRAQAELLKAERALKASERRAGDARTQETAARAAEDTRGQSTRP
jgi:hypothetical protein